MFEVMKADDDVGHLHAGVIDVVLHLHALATRAHHAHECIAQRGVAQMPDMRRFIGVDVGVLDDDLAAGRGCGFGRWGKQSLRIAGSVDTDVDVSAAGHLERRDTRNRTNFSHQFRCNLARRLLQLFGQLECGGHGQFAEIALLGLLDGHREIDAIARLDVLVKGALNLLF